MYGNRYYPLFLIADEDSDRVEPSSSSSNNNDIRTTTTKPISTPIASSRSTITTSTRHSTSPPEPLIYADRTPASISDSTREAEYRQIISQITTLPEKKRIRYSHPMRISANQAVRESYALVLISFARGENNPTVLLGQRRESVEFANFIRGVYEAHELYSMLSMMTIAERDRLLKYSFNELWEDYWPIDSKAYHSGKSRQIAQQAYEQVRPFLTQLLQLTQPIDSATAKTETEWIFPRGREKPQYTGQQNAEREFVEETTLSLVNAQRAVAIPPDREEYFGSDGVRYATTHYVYVTREEPMPKLRQIPVLRPQMVSNDFASVKWFTVEELKSKLNKYRYEMILRFIRLLSSRPTEKKDSSIVEESLHPERSNMQTEVSLPDLSPDDTTGSADDEPSSVGSSPSPAFTPRTYTQS